MKVKKIEFKGVEKCFDIRNKAQDCLDGESNFVCNDTVVHNCIKIGSKVNTTYGLIPIEKLDPSKHQIYYLAKSGLIESTDRYRVFHTGQKAVCKITMMDGRFIELTDDHLVFTNFGYRKASTICKQSIIYGINDRYPTRYKSFFVKSMEITGEVCDVYDITNADECYSNEGNFILDGLIVHNCIPDYVSRRNDPDGNWKNSEHPKVLEILKDTYGLLVYQEDLDRVWRKIGGFTGPESTEARKAVAKKWVDKLKPIEKKWIDGSVGTIGPEYARMYWGRMTTFGRYAFNKSHGVAYCLKAYACLWLKAYYPEEWWSTILTLCHRDRLEQFMMAAKRDGAIFKTFDINRLSRNFDTAGEAITPGLISLKNVGDKLAVKYSQPLSSDIVDLDDFLERRGSDKIVLERLIKLGAFKELYPNSRALMNYYLYKHATGKDITLLKKELNDKWLAHHWPESKIKEYKDKAIKDYLAGSKQRKKPPAWVERWKPKVEMTIQFIADLYEDYTQEELIKFEKEYLGFSWNSPIELYKTEDTIETAKEEGYMDAVITSIEKCKTKTQKDYARVIVSDGTQNALLLLWENDIKNQTTGMLEVGVGFRARVEYDPKRGTFTLAYGAKMVKLWKKSELAEYTMRD